MSWEPDAAASGGTREVVDGDYVITSGSRSITASVVKGSKNTTGVSLQAQLRFLDGNPNTTYAGLIARGDSASSYYGALMPNGYLFLSELGGGRSDFRGVQTALTARDMNLKLNVMGDSLSLYAWAVGDSMPESPQLHLTDSSLSAGTFGVFSGGGARVAFRSVESLADPMLVPEPMTSVLLVLGAMFLMFGRRTFRSSR